MRHQPSTEVSALGAAQRSTLDAPEPVWRAPAGPSRRARRTDELLGRNVGNYILVEQLGRGGMGAVFRARHPQIGREVAIKLIRPRRATSARASRRFLVEARAVARIDHPGVVELYDFGATDAGELYCIMELLDGCELTEVIAQRAPMPLDEARGYLEQIIEALAAAHEKGVVHRDLKPQNVFVVDGGAQGPRVKLVDFGVAKLLDAAQPQRLTMRGAVMGTPATMAPEMALGDLERVGPATDIYALGVIAFEMLAGQCPFRGASAMELVEQHVNDAPPPLGKRRPDLPPRLTDLVDGCLRKDPARRPSLDALLAALRGEPQQFPSDDRSTTSQVTSRSLLEIVAPRRRVLRRLLLALLALLTVAAFALLSSSMPVRDVASAARSGGAHRVHPVQPSGAQRLPELAQPSRSQPSR